MGQNAGKHTTGKHHTPGHSRKVSKASGDGSDSDSVDTASSSQSPSTPSGLKQGMAAFFRKQSDACKKRMDHQLYLVSCWTKVRTVAIKIFLVRYFLKVS